MSRIGKRPITIPTGVTVNYEDRTLKVKGSKGELSHFIPSVIDLSITEKEISVNAEYKTDQNAKMLMGTTQARLKNIVAGVSEGFKIILNLNGVGYRAAVKGSELELSLGFSHPVLIAIPKDITAKVVSNTKIELEGCDNVTLGQFAADIRRYRPPEPYKGKGILFEGEVVRRKAGKAGKK